MRGSYPELVANPQRDARLWQASYVQTYLERDVRNLRNIGDLTQFQILPAQLGDTQRRLLNLSDWPEMLVSRSTRRRDWLTILEASFQVFLLRPISSIWASGW